MGELLVYQRVYMYISLYTTTTTGVSLSCDWWQTKTIGTLNSEKYARFKDCSHITYNDDNPVWLRQTGKICLVYWVLKEKTLCGDMNVYPCKNANSNNTSLNSLKKSTISSYPLQVPRFKKSTMLSDVSIFTDADIGGAFASFHGNLMIEYLTYRSSLAYQNPPSRRGMPSV